MSDRSDHPDHPAEDFRSQVQRLVAEGKLTPEEAQGLLEGMDDQAENVGLRAMPASELAGNVPQNLILEVSGYALQVILDPNVPQPQLQASQEGKLRLEATSQGWRVARLPDQRLIGWSNLKALLLLPFTPQDVKATLGGGNLNLPDIHGDLKVKIGGGNLQMGSAATLHATLGGGNLKAGQIHGETHVTIGGGNANLSSYGPLNATIAGGNLNCQALLNSGDHQLTVAGGSARLDLQPGSSLNLHATATAGNVKTNFPVTRSGQMVVHTYTGTVGEGHARLNIRVAGGSVAIQA